MNIVYDDMVVALDTKSKQLKDLQDQFQVMWETQKDSPCFERNAIDALMIMQRLKTEIEHLKHYITLAKAIKEN